MAVFTDNFNRANTMAGDLGGNWQVHPTSTNRILDNKVRDKGRSLFSFGQTETPNQVVAGLFRVLSNHPLTEKYGVILRGADDAGYVAGFEINATTVTYVIWKRLNGVLTELARAGSGSPVPVGFDVPLRAVVDGSGVKIINPTTNSPIIQVNDAISPLAGPGYGGVDLGVDGLAVACAFDNFFLEDLRGPTPPYRPICSVTDITVEGATLLGSNFYDQDLDSHAASHYQVVVATASDFSTPLVSTIVQTGETPNDEGLVRRAVTGLASGTRYKARLRYQDSSGMWSEWSPIVFSPRPRKFYRCGASGTMRRPTRFPVRKPPSGCTATPS